MRPLHTGSIPFSHLAVSAALASALACQLAHAQASEPIRGRIGVGTWNTQAEFKDITVVMGKKTLYRSDFTSGLSGFQPSGGTWEAVGGNLRQTSASTPAMAFAGDPAWSDYTLTLKARKIGGAEGFLIAFGVPADSSKSWWNIGGWSNSKHALEAPGTSSAQVPGRIESGRWYDIRVELKANTIRAYLDGRLIQTATQTPQVHTVRFSTQAHGKRLALTHWGLDTAWADADNMRRGIEYMGKDHVDVVRVSFPVNEPLVNGDLPSSKNGHFTTRLEIAKMAGDKPFSMLPDTEAGVNPWFKNGNEIIPERWVQLMAAAQRRYGKKMADVEPFNEPDYGWGQGSVKNLNDILGALQNSPDFAGVQLGGPSTLNADAAKAWFDPIESRLDRGTTHSLGGTFDSYIEFYREVAARGKLLENPEAHNLVEVIAGAEYGLQSATWWGTAELARGSFVRAVHGERLAYAEDRPRWSAAAVYRAPNGNVQAFLGSSERMGETTVYRFVSRDRPVFFNGDGPRREFSIPIRKDTELLVNITWGQDVPPKVGGRYVIVNRRSGKVLGVTGAGTENGAGIRQMDYTRAANQQWEVTPDFTQYGDQSYFTVRAMHSGKSLALPGPSYAEGARVEQQGEGGAATQNWFFEYAGDNCFYIRNRWSAKCLDAAGGAKNVGASIVQTALTGKPEQRWRLIAVSELGARPIDFRAPRRPAGLKASARPRAVALHWTANREADLAGYTVFRSTKHGGPWETIARSVRGNSFVDTGASERRRYHYAVKAVDHSLNQSAFSAEATAIPGSDNR